MPYLKPDALKKGNHERTMPIKTPFPCHKVPRIARAKAKKAPIGLSAIELEGQAAPGKALNNMMTESPFGI